MSIHQALMTRSSGQWCDLTSIKFRCESMKKAFQDMLHELGRKLIQLMHTAIVPEQVKTMKIQVGIQVQDQENSEDNFSFGSALEDFI
uniref:Uncharacterized protein n=1 Tax=Tanacetum cinerariifolium TaxID=118510 RepID=A0A699HAG7_TANCI|nr:hypothetical protein [Tanacetum cinerariifolium]